MFTLRQLSNLIEKLGFVQMPESPMGRKKDIKVSEIFWENGGMDVHMECDPLTAKYDKNLYERVKAELGTAADSGSGSDPIIVYIVDTVSLGSVDDIDVCERALLGLYGRVRQRANRAAELLK